MLCKVEDNAPRVITVTLFKIGVKEPHLIFSNTPFKSSLLLPFRKVSVGECIRVEDPYIENALCFCSPHAETTCPGQHPFHWQYDTKYLWELSSAFLPVLCGLGVRASD